MLTLSTGPLSRMMSLVRKADSVFGFCNGVYVEPLGEEKGAALVHSNGYYFALYHDEKASGVTEGYFIHKRDHLPRVLKRFAACAPQVTIDRDGHLLTFSDVGMAEYHDIEPSQVIPWRKTIRPFYSSEWGSESRYQADYITRFRKVFEDDRIEFFAGTAHFEQRFLIAMPERHPALLFLMPLRQQAPRRSDQMRSSDIELAPPSRMPVLKARLQAMNAPV